MSDADRTTNALRLAHWALPAIVLSLVILAAAIVAIAIVSPLTAIGMMGGGATATVGGLVARTRRQRQTRRTG